MSVRKAAALAIAQLGVAAFFVSGVTGSALGGAAGWFVLAATALAALVRAIDIESWALLIPGGFIGRVRQAFGSRATPLAVASTLLERVLLGALAGVVVGHNTAGVALTVISGLRLTGYVTPEDLAMLLAAAVIGLLWIRARIGRGLGRQAMARGVWTGIAILALAMIWGVATLAIGAAAPFTTLGSPPPSVTMTAGRWAMRCSRGCSVSP